MNSKQAMKIILVDGYKIRQTLDTEFQIMHVNSDDPTIYSPKYYIPKGQRWVDYRFQDEVFYLLKIEKAFSKYFGEAYQRKRRELIGDLKKKKSRVEFREKSESREGLSIWYVNGKVVRETIDPEFVFGGHEFVYSYIPRGELWIDSLADPKEIPFVIFHELRERQLMGKEGKSYDTAHDFASAAEKDLRRKAGARYPGDADYPADWTRDFLVREYYPVTGN